VHRYSLRGTSGCENDGLGASAQTRNCDQRNSVDEAMPTSLVGVMCSVAAEYHSHDGVQYLVSLVAELRGVFFLYIVCVCVCLFFYCLGV
jgi:hypothetical protein